MIVADANVVVAMVIEGPASAEARAAFLRDRAWFAPPLWRSELLSALIGHIRVRRLPPAVALRALGVAERLMAGREFAPDGAAVLRLVQSSACSSYDCEYVALALDLAVPLVTWDHAVLRAFPETAVTPAAFAAA